jgi:tetratricopeptide (TPR) repeat protein
LPENHPDIAVSYNKMGHIYGVKGDTARSIEYYNKALNIQKKTLPENHPCILDSYNDIGQYYDFADEYDKALDYYNKALTIQKKTLPKNHPDIELTNKIIAGINQKKSNGGYFPQSYQGPPPVQDYSQFYGYYPGYLNYGQHGAFQPGLGYSGHLPYNRKY